MAYEPQGKYWDDLQVGNVYESAARTITETDVVLFAGLSGDFNPLHTDELFAQTTPFGKRIAHGMLIAGIATGLVNQARLCEGTTIALMGMELKWVGPVMPGDTIRAKVTVAEQKETKRPDRGVSVLDVTVVNQDGKPCMESRWTLMMARRQA